MADLVIRGMEIPKMRCGEPGYVDVRIFADGSVVMVKAAPPYCQMFEAAPLPEGHGRLIDADALKTGLFVFDEITRNYYINRKEIENAPTIVPAEGGMDE